MNEQEFAELAAGHALNALSPDDRAAFDGALAAHPEWSSYVDADASTASALAETVDEVAPPLTLRSALLSRIATLPQGDADAVAEDLPAPEIERVPAVEPTPTTSTIQAISRRSWTRSLLALAASLVLLTTLGFGAASLGQWLGRSAEVVALQQIESSPDAQTAAAELEQGGSATAHWSATVGKAVIVTDGLPELTDDETFELWFVRQDGTPVSAGTFASAGEGATTTLLAGEMEAGDTIAVTVEPAGGAPAGTPTSDPIVAIPTI
jgi:anti-sigma-K factor RskA